MASIFVPVCVSVAVITITCLKKFNGWRYECGLSSKKPLPPGDMGWPLLGNMLSFLIAFKFNRPNSFVSAFVSRFGRTGLYKSFMFGSPTILATTPETCKQVLMDDAHFVPGWPVSTVQLMGRKSFVALSHEDHDRLRKLTAPSINGHEALSNYLGWIEQRVVSAYEDWANQDRIVTFDIISYIFLSYESKTGTKLASLEREYTSLNMGIRAMAINLPGTAYHKALKARKNLVAILQSVTEERRSSPDPQAKSNKDVLNALLHVKDENGSLLTDEEIIDLLVMYLNAGHESSAHITMWAIIFLVSHPRLYAEAKAEQEKIVNKRPDGQTHLIMYEIREMNYLRKIIDESLRMVNISLMVFREATDDVEINGYTIPKGWKTQVWLRSVHMDPQVYPNPTKFDPDRWDKLIPKSGMFIPFGAGSRLCPGSDLAKMEICVFIHHLLLHYKIERLNPDCPVRYLPHPRPTDNCKARVRKLST
eukprot:Gb_05500 [translate_table: standard]